MFFQTEAELANFAENLGKFLLPQNSPICLELVGDVGAGKTTFTRYLAKGLGIKEPITSPSFTISKHYYWSAGEICANHLNSNPVEKNRNFELVHYDFYRLEDPGLMQDDLAESLSNKNTLTVLEWADSVKNILPKNHFKIIFKVHQNASRELIFNSPLKAFLKERELL